MNYDEITGGDKRIMYTRDDIQSAIALFNKLPELLSFDGISLKQEDKDLISKIGGAYEMALSTNTHTPLIETVNLFHELYGNLRFEYGVDLGDTDLAKKLRDAEAIAFNLCMRDQHQAGYDFSGGLMDLLSR